MPHCIKAFIRKKEVVEKLASEWLSVPIELPQGFFMLFLTEELFDNITELSDIKNELDNKFECFTSAIASVMEYHSFKTTLAYIETEYFGGLGSQCGVLYENGKLQIQATWEDGIINKILNKMGVLKLKEDEFDSLNLGNYRHM